ncbi:MAG: hypothetical protein ACRDZO_14930 [Egibacteraceae bacterium]
MRYKEGAAVAETYIYDDGIFIGKVDSDDYIYDHDYRYAGRIDFGGWVWDRRENLFGKDPKKDPKKLLKSYLNRQSA